MRLLSLTYDQILALSNEMDREVEAIKHNLYQMCWFMRGGLTIEQALMIDVSDQVIISKLITSNMETTKESGLPFF